MSAKTTRRRLSRARRMGWRRLALTAGGLACHSLLADPFVGVYPGEVLGTSGVVLANPMSEPPLQTQEQQSLPNEMDVFQPAGTPEGNSLPAIFRYGPAQLHPHDSYSLMYGNGIQNQPGSQQNIIIQQLSPGLRVDLGSRWAVDYTPTFQFYSSDKFRDYVNQSVELTGAVSYEAWRFGLAHSTEITSEPLAQTAAQTDTETHTTVATASRAFGSNLSADFTLSQTATLVAGFDDSYDWGTMDWVNYEFWPRLNAGLGVGGGYVLVDQAGAAAKIQSGDSNQQYEQVQARMNWRATQKLSFQISGGFEDRQFDTAGAGDSLNPIFSATILYQPFKHTQVSLTGSRTIASSDFYLAAQQIETSLVSVNLNQQLWRKFTLGGGIAYSRVDYTTPAYAGFAVNRSDDLVTLNIQLSHSLTKRGTWGLFYQNSRDNSSEAGFSYRSSQVGMTVSYSF